MRLVRSALSLALALCAAPAVLVAALPEAGAARQQQQGPVLPLRPIAQKSFGDNLIVGGQLAEEGKNPWVVALVTQSRGRLFQFCGGTLIAPQFVVTAAHCVEAGYTMQAVVGRYKLSDAGEGEVIDVEEAVSHPSYNAEVMSGDIAILRLARPVSADIAPLPLIPADLAATVKPGQDVTVLGWGLQAERENKAAKEGGADDGVEASGSDELRTVTLPVVDNAKCNAEYKELTSRDSILDEEVCAGVDRGGLDSCQGDSGGPLTATIDGQTYLFGVVSWGIGCARAKVPGVYTRVAWHEDWLASKMLLSVGTASGRALGEATVLFAGTDRATELDLALQGLSPETLQLSLGFSGDSPAGFSVDQPKLTLSGAANTQKATVRYQSAQPGVETADLVVDVARANKKPPTEQTFALTAFSLPPADFAGQPKGSWYTGGDAAGNGWVAEADGSLSSGATPDASSSVALFYFQGAGELSFKWRASCEDAYDMVYLFVDNEPVDALTGDSGWTTKSLLLDGPADKVHSAAWVYVKDKSMTKNDDKAYLKDVAFGAPAAAAASMQRIFAIPAKHEDEKEKPAPAAAAAAAKKATPAKATTRSSLRGGGIAA